MKKSLKSFVIGLLVSVGTFAQTAEYTSDVLQVNFNSNSPAIVAISSPSDLMEKSRGFKKVTTNQLVVTGAITDNDGVRSVFVNNQNVVLGQNGLFSVTLNLTNGRNDIIFDVIDMKNMSTRKVFTVEADAPVELPSLAEVSTGDGKFYALLIGVNEYDDPDIMSLDKPVADARRLGEVLEQYYTFEKENITYLENPTRNEIVDALDLMRKTLGPEDNLLLFYAGHGYWDAETETGYWIPKNGRKTSTADWFRNTTLTDQLRTIKSKHTLLVADACFSGSIFKSRAVFISEEQVAIKKLYNLPSRKAMTSGTLTEVPDRSEFLKYLTKRLADNQEKYLPSAELFSSFRRAVINNSDVIPQYGTMQKVGDEGGDFIFIRR
jgi:hypothetical protein